jgi:lysozyme
MNWLPLAAELSEAFEGLRLEPYYDPVGYPTIGYGHLLSRVPWEALDRYSPITKAEAEQLLFDDLWVAHRAVRRLCPVELTDGQLAALTDFAFNLGGGALQHSTLRYTILRGDFDGAARQFGRWVYARGIKLPGLVRRRAAERAVFVADLLQ